MGNGKNYALNECYECYGEGKKLKQYVSRAFSPLDKEAKARPQTSKELIGIPDSANLCEIDANAWFPLYRCNIEDCYADVYFERKVIPTEIKIWVINEAEDSIRNIQLVYSDNTTSSLGKIRNY